DAIQALQQVHHRAGSVVAAGQADAEQGHLALSLHVWGACRLARAKLNAREECAQGCVVAGDSRVGMAMLHRSMWPAGRLYQSSRRLRRDSTTASNSGVSVRSTCSLVRCASGTSAASRIDL